MISGVKNLIMDSQTKYFYIDPMSYNNLSLYDKNLLENIGHGDKVFYANSKYEFSDNEKFKIKKIQL